MLQSTNVYVCGITGYSNVGVIFENMIVYNVGGPDTVWEVLIILHLRIVTHITAMILLMLEVMEMGFRLIILVVGDSNFYRM